MKLKTLLLLATLILFTSCGKESYFTEIGIPARENSKGDYGIVGLDGKMIVDFAIDERPSIMIENWAYYERDDKLIFIDAQGNERYTDFQDALHFNEGYMLVRLGNGKLAFVDTNLDTKLVLNDVEAAGSLSEGLFAFKNSEGLWGYMNLEGSVIVQPKYNSVSYFKEGLAVVSQIDIDRNELIGYIDTKGEQALRLTTKYEELGHFSDGLASFRKDDERGYLNKNFEEVIDSDGWRQVSTFVDGYATVRGKDDKEYGLIDSDGEYVIKTRERYPIRFYNGLSVFQGSNRKFGFMDKNRKIITRAEFEEILPFFNSGALAKDGGEWLYINEDGMNQGNDLPSIKYLYHESFTNSVIEDNTAFNLIENISSTYINSEGLIEELFNPISGTVKSFDGGVDASISSISNLLERFDEGVEYDIMDIFNKYSRRIDTRSMTNNYFNYDDNQSYSIRLSYDNYFIKKTEIGNTSNPEANLEEIRVIIKLGNKGYGRAKEFRNQLTQYFESSGFELDENNRSYLNSDSTVSIDISNEYSSLTVTYKNLLKGNN